MNSDDKATRRLINAIQDDLPLTRRPFAALADRLGLSEIELIGQIRALKDSGILTRFGPFFDAEAMGGAFCLCALAAPSERFDEIVEIVNAFPEVAHNYRRDHRLNMWFVLATETPEGITGAADAIQQATDLKILRFPKLQEFFVGFRVAA